MLNGFSESQIEVRVFHAKVGAFRVFCKLFFQIVLRTKVKLKSVCNYLVCNYFSLIRRTRRRTCEPCGTSGSPINTSSSAFFTISAFSSLDSTALGVNCKKPGLHYHGKNKDNTREVLTEWSPDFVKFPNQTIKYDCMSENEEWLS